MKFISLLLFIGFCSLQGKAQGLSIENAMDSLYATVSPQLLVLGEEHTKDNTRHYAKIIKYLYETQGVRTVAWEMPKSFEMQMNAFLLDGDSQVFEALRKIPMMNKKDHLQLLTEIRTLNETIAIEDKIHMLGFDVESDTEKDVFIGVKRFFKGFDLLNVPRLDSLIQTKPFGAYESEMACVEMVRMLYADKEHYSSIFGEKFQSLIDVIEGSHFKAVYQDSPGDTISVKRELFMTRMLSNWFKENAAEKMILICGADHGSLLEEDDWTLAPASMVLNLKNELNIVTYSFRTVYYNNRRGLIGSLFKDELDYLRINLDEAFERSDYEDYLFFFEKEIESSTEFSTRYDGLLVKNCYRRKR